MEAASRIQRVVVALEAMIGKADRAEPIALAVDAAGVCRRQLERDFRWLGTSPAAELRRIRLHLAMGELTYVRAGSWKLDGVARRTGYRGTRRLRDAMTNAYGLPPGEIRRAARLARALRLPPSMKSKPDGSTVRNWSHAYHRRRAQATLTRLLQKATPEAQRVILGDVRPPRAREAGEQARELAFARAIELFKASQSDFAEAA